MRSKGTHDLAGRDASNEPVAVRKIAFFRVLAPSEL